MKQSILALTVAAALFSACSDDDEIVEVKDYGLKTFEADLKYTSIPDPNGGRPTTTYAQQTYFAFGKEEAIAVAEIGTENWTKFNVFSKDSADYNISSDIEGWHLIFTNYTGNGANPGDDPVEYSLTGILHNAETDIKVAEMEYTESTEANDVSQAFAALSLTDVASLSYSTEPETIGRDWKKLNSTFQYDVLSNKFYFVKLSNEDIYKLRVISFYGETTSNRIIKIEYQLMQ